MKQFAFCLLLISVFSNNAYCQTDFFWSDKNLHQGAVNRPLKLVAPIGQEVDLYLYYTVNGPINSNISRGLSLDLEIVGGRFVSAETLDFDICLLGVQEIDRRWGNGFFGAAAEVADDFVVGLQCFSTINDGITSTHTGPTLFDLGHDPSADAFLVGRVRVELTSAAGAEITTSIGENLIVDDDLGKNARRLNPTFGCVSIFDGTAPSTYQSDCFFQDPLLGDVNLDGDVSLLDVAPFVELIAGSQFQIEADINQDGAVNTLDVFGMVNLLSGKCATYNGKPLGPGDVNCDGCIDIVDASELLVHLRDIFVFEQEPNPCSFETSDVNGDGSINLLDLPPLHNLIIEK